MAAADPEAIVARERLDARNGWHRELARESFGLARTRIRVETRHLAFLDGLAARVRIENHGRTSRAELFAILVRILLSSDVDPERVNSESALVDLLHERISRDRADAAHDLRSVDDREADGVPHGAPPPTETVNLRIPSDELARLDLFLAEIRGRCGVFIGRSGVVRALINWLAELNIAISGIRIGADLEERLSRLLARSAAEPGFDSNVTS